MDNNPTDPNQGGMGGGMPAGDTSTPPAAPVSDQGGMGGGMPAGDTSTPPAAPVSDAPTTEMPTETPTEAPATNEQPGGGTGTM